MGIRIIWYYEGDKMIILVDVAHHDILEQLLRTVVPPLLRGGIFGNPSHEMNNC